MMSMDSTPCTLSDESSVSLIPDKDQIEGDAESENTKHMSSYNRPQYFTPPYSLKPQHITSLDGYYFIQYMNKIGWPQGGTFSTLLSTVGYDFHEENGLMVPKAEEYKVKDALVVLILELLPFYLLKGPDLQLPIEIWEHIIDFIDDWSSITAELCACTRVCRSWRTRAKLRLYEDVKLYKHGVSKFQTVVRKYPNLPLASMKKMLVDCETRPISGFFTIYKFKNLRYLRINDLDLTREHLPVTKGPIFRTVTHLLLTEIRSCTVSNILRFINSFHSLNELELLCRTPKLFKHEGGVLSPLRSASIPRLRRLRLWVVPGVGELIKWYIQEGHFLKSLEVLGLNSDIEYDEPSPEYHAFIDGCTALLGHCAGTLRDLTFGGASLNKTPLVDEVINIVVLSSLPNLRKMKWFCWSFQIAAAQISSVREPCKIIEEVRLKIWNFRENWNEREKDHCMIIDNALAGDNFPSLRLVTLKKDIPWDYFPILKSRNLLEATKF